MTINHSDKRPLTIVSEKDGYPSVKSQKSAMLIHDSAQDALPRYAEISPASISKYIDEFRQFRQLAVNALLC